MFYEIKHTTKYQYDNIISESVMEVRKRPRSEGAQRCLKFMLNVQPHAKVSVYRDHMGNFVHHFNVPTRHDVLVIDAVSIVESVDPDSLPESLPAEAWDELDSLRGTLEYYDFLASSPLTKAPALLRELREEINLQRSSDPLTQLVELNSIIYGLFDYVPDSTSVDSPVDDVIIGRKGVCQDFAHVMLALGRWLGIPCRYVSGYLYHQENNDDARSVPDATHAWVEAFLPDLGWVGFDPTNNLICDQRHIRVAVGSDYLDVPPTHGVFKGNAHSKLSVDVSVSQTEEPPEDDMLPPANWPVVNTYTAQQQQQQQ